MIKFIITGLLAACAFTIFFGAVITYTDHNPETWDDATRQLFYVCAMVSFMLGVGGSVLLYFDGK
jgi:hypothetical protein